MTSVDMDKGRRLYANREEEPSDWGDWADENAAAIMDEVELLVGFLGKAASQVLRGKLDNMFCGTCQEDENGFAGHCAGCGRVF